VNLKKSWISEHPRVVIGFILVACLGPFLNKAIHTDDTLYVWAGKWIQKHPADFFGSEVNWWTSAIPMWKANWNPPLLSYFLAGVAFVFGWNVIALHFAGLVVAFACAAGIYSLADIWCKWPLLAVVVAIFTPVFLVSSTTLMCDVPMLTCWVWALVFWEHSLANERSRWQFVGAGLLAGLAVLTKYSAITLLPLLPILSLLRKRKSGVWWMLGLLVPLVMLAGYEWMTARMYGARLFSAAIGHTQHNRGFPDVWEARGIIGLAFAGGCFLPLLCFAPFLWRWRALLVGGAVTFAGLLGTLWFGGKPSGFVLSGSSEPTSHWDFLLQLVLLSAGGLHLLLLTLAEARQRRNIISVILTLWILNGLFSAIVLNFTVNARGFLLLVPAVAILLVRRLEAIRGKLKAGIWLLGPMVPAAVIALSLAATDYRWADTEKTAAKQIAVKYKSPNHGMWFEGHNGFQYYMGQFGGRSIDIERSLLETGDIVVVPWINDAFVPLPVGSVQLLEILGFGPQSWLNLNGENPHGAAGFFGAGFGPLPFVVGSPPRQDYFILRVCSPVQFDSRPVNPQAVQAGGVPSSSSLSFKCEPLAPERPEAMAQVKLAQQLERAGKIPEAIQHYRQALDLDPDDVRALNNLAWILTTARHLELRNAEEAVQLALKAVRLTDGKQPVMIGTLAAAYAEAGQFSKAVEAASFAQNLALVTGQREVAAKNAKLINLYSAGLTAAASGNP
jgi:4-amino-4-deoxy-L-arabinose transferase-like glycosyltransferase